MRSSGHAFAHWSQTMQVCAPVAGSVCSRRTPRNRGAVGRRSAGYWNVNAGCGGYFSVSPIPFIRSMRKMVFRNLMIVCIGAVASALRPLAVGVEPLTVECGFGVARHDRALLAKGGAFLADLVLQAHQAVEQCLGTRRAAGDVHVNGYDLVHALQH